MFPRMILLGSITISLFCGVLSCSDTNKIADLTSADSRSAPQTIAISPDSSTLRTGDSLTLKATITDAGGRALVQSAPTWTTSDTLIARVTPSGVVTGVATGVATITATSGVTSAPTTVTVTAAVLTGLTLTPSAVTLTTGGSYNFTAAGTWSDGATRGVTPSFTATGGTVTTSGVYIAGTAAGSYRVIATASGLSDTSVVTVTAPVLGKTDTSAVAVTTKAPGKADTSSVTVTAPTMTGLVLTPSTVSLQAGAQQQFTAAATWSNGSATLPQLSFNATGGTISSSGLFTAGSSAGTFRVIVQQLGGTRADTVAVVVTVPGPPPLVLGDRVNYTKGQYGAYASPWSTFVDSTLRQGIDYSDSIIVNPASFTDSSTIRWHWPNRLSTKTGVWGYMTIWFGNYDGGPPAVQVTPRQVKNISVLRQDFVLSRSSAGSFNVLDEFYLTSQAGNPTAKVIEIGYFLHPSTQALTFQSQGKLVGTYQDTSGRTWEARMQGTFCMLIAAGGEDVLSGSIDTKATLSFLIANGVITGDEWFNGIALGVEPVIGSGELDIGRWAVSYQ